MVAVVVAVLKVVQALQTPADYQAVQVEDKDGVVQ
jgi:hypothetical protein